MNDDEKIMKLLKMKDDCVEKIIFFRQQMWKCREGIETANKIIDEIDELLRKEGLI